MSSRSRAAHLVTMMWPKDQPITIEQHESVVDIVEHVIDEYKHKTDQKVQAIEAVWKHNYEFAEKKLQELENGSRSSTDKRKEVKVRPNGKGHDAPFPRGV